MKFIATLVINKGSNDSLTPMLISPNDDLFLVPPSGFSPEMVDMAARVEASGRVEVVGAIVQYEPEEQT